MAYRIVSDVSADVSKELLAGLPEPFLIPMDVVLGSEPHVYGPGGDLDNREFYAALRAGKFASTSQITPEAYRRAFRSVLDAGEDVFYLGLTQGLSSAYGNACMVAEELREEYPERKIYAVESYCASVGLGFFVREALERQREGMAIDELAAWAEESRLHVCHWFTVDVFDHLKHGGRVSAAAAAVGSLLQIKPMLRIAEDGTLTVIDKPRGRKQAVRRQLDHMRNNWDTARGKLVLIGHGDDEEAARQLKEAVLAEYPDADVRTAWIGALIGAHTGPGMLALIHWGFRR